MDDATQATASGTLNFKISASELLDPYLSEFLVAQIVDNPSL